MARPSRYSPASPELSSFPDGGQRPGFTGVQAGEGQASGTDAVQFASDEEAVSKTAIASHYNIPGWFLRHAMSTPEEIDTKQCNLRIIDTARRDLEDNSGKGSSNDTESNAEPGVQGDPFEIHRDVYSELQDVIAAACVVDNVGQFPALETSVLLQYDSSDGEAFCDEILIHVAKDMRASLVSLDLEDLEDLAGEFDDQDKTKRKVDDIEISDKNGPDSNDEFGFAKHYFAVRSKKNETQEARERNKRGITSLLGSLNVNRPGEVTDAGGLSPSRQSVLLLNVRGTETILNLSRGRRFFARFWEIVAEKRKEGNPIVLICNQAANEDTGTYCCKWCSRGGSHVLKRKIRIGKANVVSLTSCGSDTKRNTTLDCPTGTRNMRRLKRMLRRRLAYAFSEEDLDPRTDWTPKGLAPQSMAKVSWSEDDLQRVVTRIAGRYWRFSKIGLDDVCDVLTHLDLLHIPADEATIIPEDDDENGDSGKNDDKKNPDTENGKTSNNDDVVENKDSEEKPDKENPDDDERELENNAIDVNENDSDDEESSSPEAWPIVASVSKQAWQEQKAARYESNAALDELMDMIGLESVKERFMEIKNLADTTCRQGVDLTKEYFGCLFVGRPGSGKTVIAALYARLLSLLKIVSGPKLKTTTGIRLLHGGISECKDLIKEFESSPGFFSSRSSDYSSDGEGGVLLVDEAHHLLTSGNDVLGFLVSEIDRLRGKVVFIFAGYPKAMETFLSCTPGLQSRIPFQIKFEDYEDGELHRILFQLLKKKFKGKMRVEDGINGLYMRILVRRIGRARSRPNFANAREVQNTLLSILSRQASRLADSRRQNEDADDFFLTKTDLIGSAPSTALKDSKAWRSLREMIGLVSVKESVQALIDQLQVNYDRELAELPPVEYSLNKVFLGNPGTGKTTVAKHYGQILVDIGLLTNGEVIIKTPADFMGSALGESENMTKAILDSAQGKVLIIDEAYGLSDSSDDLSTTTSQNPYKSAVLDTIIAEVQGTTNEDRCVLLLGYKDKMEVMFQRVNPALGRRFPLSSAFDFQDYSKDEMRHILNMRLAESGFTASDSAKEVAMRVLDQARNHRNYGNAGEVDILLDRAKIHQRKRLSALADDGDANLRFEPRDFDPDFDRKDRAETSIRQIFADFVGAEALIDKIEGYQRIVRNAEALDIDPRLQIPFTFLFRGPPGTGKTTTARRMGEVLYNMGFLATMDVVNCSGTELIGEFVGQTGPKTQRLFQKALGKVLFIDEAYHLADNRFGQEAVAEMMNLLTQDKYRNKIIVILAGYDKDINRLLSINPGFGSRFSEVLKFDHLTPEQCFRLLVRVLQEQKLDTSTIKTLTETKLLGPFQDLTILPGWGNARDIQTIARSVFGTIIKSGTQPPSLVVTDEIIQSEIDQMLSERRGRARDARKLSESNDIGEQPSTAPPSEAEQQRETSKAGLEEAILRKEITPAALSKRIDAQRNRYRAEVDRLQSSRKGIDMASFKALRTPLDAMNTTPRDDGVSDTIWTQLQECKTQKKRKRQEIDESRAKLAQLEADIEQIQVANGDSSQTRRRLIELRKSFKKMKAAADTETKIMSRLMESGLCPLGYEWIKENDGYRCAGGTHFKSNEDIRLEYNL